MSASDTLLTSDNDDLQEHVHQPGSVWSGRVGHANLVLAAHFPIRKSVVYTKHPQGRDVAALFRSLAREHSKTNLDFKISPAAQQTNENTYYRRDPPCPFTKWRLRAGTGTNPSTAYSALDIIFSAGTFVKMWFQANVETEPCLDSLSSTPRRPTNSTRPHNEWV